MKDVEMQTEPPDKVNFSGLLTQWVIYDKYIKYEAAKELAEAEDNKNCVQQIRRRFFEVEQETVMQKEKEKMHLRCHQQRPTIA